MLDPNNPAVIALNNNLKKSRVHFYKPIQIAEILYHHRMNPDFDLADLESYRNISKRWRDDVTRNLVGNVSTSSAKFQDDLFNKDAVPPETIKVLGAINEENPGCVEAHVYLKFQEKLMNVHNVGVYLESLGAETFDLATVLNFFSSDNGLKKSLDKVYEITTYSLFMTIVRELKATVTLEILSEDDEILEDLSDFTQAVLGIDKDNKKLVSAAALYRVGVANASDGGVDMWANFGPVIQVKHLSLTAEKAQSITNSLSTDKIVIVCLTSERQAIEAVLQQVGWGSKIQCIITLEDLKRWYEICFSTKYKNSLGTNLLSDFKREFHFEFPSNANIQPFLELRGYI